jgi:hypothetical protein
VHGRTVDRGQAASYGVLSTVSAIFVGDEDLEPSDVFFVHVWWDLQGSAPSVPVADFAYWSCLYLQRHLQLPSGYGDANEDSHVSWGEPWVPFPYVL